MHSSRREIRSQIEQLSEREECSRFTLTLRRRSSVHFRIRLPHFAGLLLGAANLNQRTLAHSGTILCGFEPLPPALDQLGPERENPALRRLHRVDGASALAQEAALRIARYAQPDLALCA